MELENQQGRGNLMLPASQVEFAKSVCVIDLARDMTTLRGGPVEYYGPCPRCGGTDRLHIHARRNLWFCRKCTGADHWHDSIDWVQLMRGVGFVQAVNILASNTGLSDEERAAIVAERLRKADEEERNLAKLQAARLAQFIEAKPWIAAHQALTDEARALWAERGFYNAQWLRYYMLGWCPSREWASGRDTWTGPSLTIPYLRNNNGSLVAVGMAHRLIGNGNDKYRPHLSGMGKRLYVANYKETSEHGSVLVVEGEIKAAVTWAWARTNGNKPIVDQVIGVAGKDIKPDHAKVLSKFDTIYLCLDPDVTQERVSRTAWQIDPVKCRIINLPGKIDDMLVGRQLTATDLAGLLTTATKPM